MAVGLPTADFLSRARKAIRSNEMVRDNSGPDEWRQTFPSVVVEITDTTPIVVTTTTTTTTTTTGTGTTTLGAPSFIGLLSMAQYHALPPEEAHTDKVVYEGQLLYRDMGDLGDDSWWYTGEPVYVQDYNNGELVLDHLYAGQLIAEYEGYAVIGVDASSARGCCPDPGDPPEGWEASNDACYTDTIEIDCDVDGVTKIYRRIRLFLLCSGMFRTWTGPWDTIYPPALPGE